MMFSTVKPTAAILLILCVLGSSPVRGWGESMVRIGFDSKRGYSEGVVVKSGGLLLTDQFFPPEGVAGIEDQIAPTFEALEKSLNAAGTSAERIVRLNVAARSDEAVGVFESFLKARFNPETAPAVTFMVGDLPKPDQHIALDAVALAGAVDSELESGRILPDGPRVYISGQAKPGDFETAVAETMKSLFATLEFLGLAPSDVVQLKAFVQPIDRADEARRLMAEAFGEAAAPPMVTVEWFSSLPIEIELIASAKGKDLRRGQWGKPVEWITPPGETPSPVFSRLAYVEGPAAVYTSSLFGEPGSSADEQIHQIFKSLKMILAEAGSDFDHLVKATYYVSNDETSSKLNEIRPEYYHPSRPPAASKAMVRGSGREGCGIGIDMIAVPKAGSGKE